MSTVLTELELEEIAQDEIQSIEKSKPFDRLAEKTQVLVPIAGRDSITKTRLTHSYEVSTSAKIMAIAIAKQLNCSYADIDYQNAIKQTCLLHDIGHPPFGHDGADLIQEIFKEKGVKEVFDDNNNNLVVIEAHEIKVRDYIKASVIKYPHKLYQDQKEKYLPLLNKAKLEDKEHFKKLGIDLDTNKMKQTITSQIMDEADRNSYTCSDLADFYCLGNKIDKKELAKVIDMSTPSQMLYVKQMMEVVNSGSSREIKKYFNDMKNQFNKNFKLGNEGLEPIDQELFNFRETLSKIELEFFIKPIRKEEFHLNNMKMLKVFIDNSLDNGFCQSGTYQEKIKNSKNESEKITHIQNMVGEVSDWFVITTGTNMVNNNLINNFSNKINTTVEPESNTSIVKQGLRKQKL
jgi:dGTP triphosphohydrolase